MVKHLSKNIKYLLTLRNPNPRPSPPQQTLNSILASTLQDAKNWKAETGWLVLTTCTLLTVNRPSSLGHLYRFATRKDPSSLDSRQSFTAALNTAALMRESCLKSVIFVGVPRTLNSLAALTEVLEDDVRTSLRSHSQRTANPDNIDALLERGRALWHSIYEPHAEKLYNKLGSYHPDFISFIIQSYGSVLSPLPGANEQGNLSRTLGSVVGTACLRAEGGVGPQLTSHVFGLLKAHGEEHQSAEDAWLSSDEGAEWVLRTVDKILDVVTSEEGMPQVKL